MGLCRVFTCAVADVRACGCRVTCPKGRLKFRRFGIRQGQLFAPSSNCPSPFPRRPFAPPLRPCRPQRKPDCASCHSPRTALCSITRHSFPTLSLLHSSSALSQISRICTNRPPATSLPQTLRSRVLTVPDSASRNLPIRYSRQGAELARPRPLLFQSHTSSILLRRSPVPTPRWRIHPAFRPLRPFVPRLTAGEGSTEHTHHVQRSHLLLAYAPSSCFVHHEQSRCGRRPGQRQS